MPVRIATAVDIDGWLELRARLWPETPHDEHRAEIAQMLARPEGQCAGFIEISEETEARAFAEVALRHDYVNGCETSPVAFLEGIYVHPEHRRAGLGRALLAAIRAWAREQGCTELASDAYLDNVESHAFHAALGFEETQRVVYFRKAL
ncbi:aminoglycoside 6'-N-acetyltransferase [Oceaniglobus trochenteri]|uniref:aminoglycoside 6'-N-acetyltransferase n=1 Tax=Oceaniglobus trochenteri TaxID=2763260 RepID=UPI001CFFD3D7|nr:aminoglycoside 6'-N-acetyltransferase [Oceaniglobus trochenteri]